MEKARKRLDAILEVTRVPVLPSHNEILLRRVCNTIAELEGG